MTMLYGQSWERRELEAHVGRMEQIAGIQHFTLSEGFSAGVEQALVRTGAGLSYVVSFSKGMDISLAEFGGVPSVGNLPTAMPTRHITNQKAMTGCVRLPAAY